MATSKKKSRVGAPELESEVDSIKDGKNGLTFEEEGAEHMEEGADSSTDDESDTDSEEMDIEEKINVEFEARNPEEMDFHGIRQLLLQLFLKSNIDISEVADWILSQKYVGSVIKQYLGDDMDEEEDEEEVEADANQVYGVICAMNLSKHKTKTCVGQIKNHLTEKLSGDKSAKTKLKSILDDSNNNLGLIINERFVNIPAQIAVPSFDSLCSEMETAASKGEDYNCTHYLMVCKKFRMKTSKPGKKRRSKKPIDPEIYSNAEEEVFAEAAEFRATFSVAGERDSGVVQQWDSELEDQYEPLREVIVFKSDKLPQILTKMKQYLAQPSNS